jgi:3-phenylpropionate/trans-cinnamate dioxygenase ferredoxin reductase subunit
VSDPEAGDDRPGVIAFLIIGAGPAGLSAARSYRKHGGTGRVVMLAADADAPYNRPPLSKDFLRGESDESALPMTEPGELDRLEVTLTTADVRDVDVEGRVARTQDGQSFPWTRLLFATGSSPVPLPVPGGDSAELLYLRELSDCRRLKAAAAKARSAVVVGSGFIGSEAAASLSRLGLHVTQLSTESAPQANRLGRDAGERISGWLAEEKVDVRGSAEVRSFEFGQHSGQDGGDGGVTVRADHTNDVTADLVLVAAGIKPNSDLAEAAGLPVESGRILADPRMRTSVDGVFAAGDVALAQNASVGRRLPVEHWDEAETMGRIAGATAAGLSDTQDEDYQWDAVPGFWSQIGDHWLQYAAWGDGYENARLVDHSDGGWTVWYTDETGVAVGVLTFSHDSDYDQGKKLIAQAGVPPA